MRLLIIEDEYKLSDAMSEVLRRENHIVDVCYDGEEGLDKSLTGIYDVIILDLMIPKIDGFEILKYIRQEKIDTYVIILSAKSELDDKIKGFDIGADDYVTKPFYMKELCAKLKAFSRRYEDSDNNTLSFEDLKLDLKSCELSNVKNNQSIILSGKEFTLLEFLLRNKNQVINKEQITQRIWGYDNDAQYNNVEVYISFIRKKIKFLDLNINIKSIRGLGYKMEEIDD